MILPSSDPSPPQIGLHCGLNVLVPHDDGLDHLDIALRLPEPLFPLVCMQKDTPLRLILKRSALKFFKNLRLIQLRAGRDMVVHHQKMEFFLIAVLLVVHGGQKHAAGVDSHHGSRREIRDGDQCLADQLFRLIVSVNTGKDHAVCAGSIVQDELQELLGLRNCLAGFYLHRPEIGLAEGVKVHLLLEERLNLHIREVNAVVRCKESALVPGSRVRILPIRGSFGGFSGLCFRRRSGRSSTPESRN